MTTDIEIRHKTKHSFETAIERVTTELKTEGFGILTTIDVQATLREKIGVAFPRYTILGACNPTLAHEALKADPRVGLLLPCNVVVSEGREGVALEAVRPTVLLAQLVGRPGMERLAQDAEARLARAVQKAAGP